MAKANNKPTPDAQSPESLVPDDSVAQANPNKDDDSQGISFPDSVRLSAPYGFIDEDTGVNYYWQAAQEVTDPDEIKVLIERKAPLE